MNLLKIDTSNNAEITVSLVVDKNEDGITHAVDNRKSQVVLMLIDKLLHTHNLDKTDLDEIHVHTGPGSFTGLRVGVAVANALSLSLNIPINGQAPGTVVTPTYV